MEYEIEAEIMHEFLRNRAKGEAYGRLLPAATGQEPCIIYPITRNVKTAN